MKEVGNQIMLLGKNNEVKVEKHETPVLNQIIRI